MRTEDRVIPDLPCGRDEHLVRDTQAPELRGRQGAAATHRAASVAYAVTGAALTGWPGGTCGYRPISARSHRRVASPQPSTTLPTPLGTRRPGERAGSIRLSRSRPSGQWRPLRAVACDRLRRPLTRRPLARVCRLHGERPRTRTYPEGVDGIQSRRYHSDIPHLAAASTFRRNSAISTSMSPTRC